MTSASAETTVAESQAGAPDSTGDVLAPGSAPRRRGVGDVLTNFELAARPGGGTLLRVQLQLP